MRINIYVDGFNLYYRALKKNPSCKWLDLRLLVDNILRPEYPNLSIGSTYYFTARVFPTKKDPNIHVRQDIYLSALKKHIPNMYCPEGRFLENVKQAVTATNKELRKYNPPLTQFKVKVKGKLKTYQNSLADEYQPIYVNTREEKGSDVNLAVSMVQHAWEDNYDVAVMISDDTDLLQALRFVKKQKKKVIYLSPSGNPVGLIKGWAYRSFPITKDALAKSQLPDPIAGTNIHKPKSWQSMRKPA